MSLSGMGAMATVETIVSKIEEQLEKTHCDVIVNDLPGHLCAL